MRALLALLIFSFGLNAQATERTPCNLRALVAASSEQLPQSSKVIRTSDGRGYVNPALPPMRLSFGDEQSRRAQLMSSIRPRTQAEIEVIFNEIRNSLIQEISGGLPENQQSPQQRLMIERVRVLRVLKEDCEGQGSNTMAESIVRICISAHRTPIAALVSLIGHEIGHSIDLCNLSGTFHRCVNHGTRMDLASGATGPAAESLRRASSNRATHMLLTSREDEPLSAPVRRLVAGGHLEVLDRGVPLENNPALATYRCLENSNGYAEMPPDGDRTCSNVRQYSEAGAQIWGARALARYVERNPNLSRADLLGAFDGVYPLRAKGFSEKEKDAQSIYMSEPALQRALNCEPAPEQNCMSFFNPGRAVGSSPAKAGAPEAIR